MSEYSKELVNSAHHGSRPESAPNSLDELFLGLSLKAHDLASKRAASLETFSIYRDLDLFGFASSAFDRCNVSTPCLSSAEILAKAREIAINVN